MITHLILARVLTYKEQKEQLQIFWDFPQQKGTVVTHYFCVRNPFSVIEDHSKVRALIGTQHALDVTFTPLTDLANADTTRSVGFCYLSFHLCLMMV